ncbi:MAG: hypothetical protein RBT86_04625 [Azospira sp.]|jgi:hypothetical protein|nr:hypothetical protein [Azospira sp.]
MAGQQVLYLAGAEAAAWRFVRGTPTVVRFGDDAEGHLRFTEHARAHRRDRFTLLVNIADEEFHIETLPALRGRDRAAVIARHLARRFPDTPHVDSQSLGHLRTRRREERVLLAALTAPARLAPWIAALDETGAALAGIQSLPFLAPRLLARIAPGTDNALLFSFQDGSLRQSLVVRGRLLFSRLVAREGDALDQLATEALALRRYLIGHGLLADGSAPIAIAIVPADCLRNGERAGDIRLIADDDCARRAGLRKLPENDCLDAACARLALSIRRPSQFATPALRHGDRQRRQARALHFAGVLAFLAGSAFASHQWQGIRDLDTAAAGLRAEAAHLRTRLEETAARHLAEGGATRPTTEHAAWLRIVERHAALRRESTGPAAIYGTLGRILVETPAVTVEVIDWQARDAAEHLRLHGRIDSDGDGDGDASVGAADMQNVFNRLLVALAREPALAVHIEHAPGNGGGETQDSGFVLRIVHGPRNGRPPPTAAP